jgi:hypothetical protein
MVWTLEDILGDENDPEFSNPSNPNFQLANYLRQPAANTPMAPTTTSPDFLVATEAAELEAPTPTPAEVTTEVPDASDEEFYKDMSDGIDEAHLNDAAEAAEKAEKEGRDFAALPLEPPERVSEELESARGAVRSSRRREPIMEDDSDEEPDRRRKIPTTNSGPEPYDFSSLQVSVITEDMPLKEVNLRNKQNLRISELKMDDQHKKNKAEAEREQLWAKATARRAQILGEKVDDQADGEVEAARARARSSRRHELITMEEKELAEAARRHQITEKSTQEEDSEEENEDEKSVHEDAAEYSGDESEPIIPKQPQVASSSYVVTRRSGNITLKFKMPEGAQKPSVGSLEPTPGIPESYPGFSMKLNTDVLPPESDSESEEDAEEGEEEEEEDEDDNALCSDEESEDDHGSLTKILRNPPVPAYLSSKAKVPRRRRGISPPFSGVPTLPPAPKFTPLAKSPFVPQPQPQPIQTPSPFMGFGSYARNATTAPPPPPSSIPFDPMKPESNFTFVKATSFTPTPWKPVIPVQKPSTNATSFTPIPWGPGLPIRKTSTNATLSAQVPSTRPGLMTSPPIPEPEVQAYEYVHETRTERDSTSSAASEASNDEEDETFAFSDYEQQSNDTDVIISATNDIELLDAEDTANVVINSNNNEEGNVVDSNSNISYRSIVDLDWDIDEPVTPRRSDPIALMDEEAILQYISAGPESGVSDQHVTELALQLEKWSVSESEIVAATPPPPEMGPTTGINPTSPPQHPAASNVTLDSLQQSVSNVSLDSSQQSNQDAASISEQERDTNSSQSSVEPDLIQTKDTASSSAQGQETSSLQSSVESNLVKSLREQLRKANERADTAEANLAAEKKAREAEQSSKKLIEEPIQQPLHPAIEQQSAKKPADEPVQQPLQPTVEQQPIHANSVLDIPAGPEGVDPVPVQSGPVDPPPVDPGITSRLNQLLGAPCKVNLKTVLRTAKERLESEEAFRLEQLKYKSRKQRMEEENVELQNSNITSTNVPHPNSNNISANVVSSTFNNEPRDSPAPRTPTLRGLAATLCISFIIPMAVSFFL